MERDTGFSAEDLRKVLASSEFVRSERMARFLTYLWEQAQAAEPRKLKEIEVGQAVFDRAPDYDPKVDSIVRVEATRLRKKLAAYYAGEGLGDAVQMRVPAGRYELEFVRVEAPEVPQAPEVAEEDRHPLADARGSVGESAVGASRRGWIYGLAAVAGLTVLAAMWALPRRVELVDAAPLTALKGREQTPAIAPDGKQVAFTWDGEADGVDRLYLTGMGSGQPRRVTATGTAERVQESCPAWSSDSAELGYLRRVREGWLELRVRRMAGGAEESITELRSATAACPGLSFSPDGRWLLTAEVGAEGNLHHLVLVERASRAKRFFRPVSGLPAARMSPAFSPDGRQVAFVEWTEGSSADVYVAGFPDGEERRLTTDHRPVRGLAWTPDGRALVVASYRERGGGSLWRLALDGGAMQRLTPPGNQSWNPSVARDGALVFSRHVESTHVRLGVQGAAFIVSTGLNSTPRFSPDGRRLAFRSNRSGASEIWVADVPEGNARRVTNLNGPVTGSPRWSRDGRWLAFDSRRFGKADVFVVPADGGEPRRITEADSNEVVPSFSADGRWVYYATDREGGWSVWRKPVAGGSEEWVRRRGFAPVVSPDGKWLYFTHGLAEDGLFRAPVDTPEREEPVLPGLAAGLWGNWALSGGALYWVNPVAGGGALQRRDAEGRVETLASIELPVWWDGGLDVTADGARVAFASVERSDSDLYWAAVK